MLFLVDVILGESRTKGKTLLHWEEMLLGRAPVVYEATDPPVFHNDFEACHKFWWLAVM